LCDNRPTDAIEINLFHGVENEFFLGIGNASLPEGLTAKVETVKNQSRAHEVRSYFAWSTTAKANNTDVKELQIGMVD